MDLKLVRTFLTAAQFNNLTKTAQQLGYAQSTVTTQIKLLEEELNTPLFDRLGRSISLSPDGKAFLPYAKQLLSLEEEIKHTFGTGSTPAPITIGASQSLCNSLVPTIIERYQKRYPKVPLTIRLENSHHLVSLLKENEIDLAIGMQCHIPDPDLMEYHSKSEPISFFASISHPLNQMDSLTLETLSSYPFLLTAKDCFYHKSLTGLLDLRGLSYQIFLESDNLSLLKQFAIQGLGILFLPDLAVQEELHDSKLKKLHLMDAPEITSTSQVLLQKGKQMNTNLKNLLAVIDEVF